MLPPATRLISVDDHVIEHPRVWLDRLPARYHDQAPRVVELANGRQAWRYEDVVVTLDRPIVKLHPDLTEEPPHYQVRFDEMRPGCYDPKARLEDMEIDGVWAQLCFPNFARFAGHRFLFGQDRELALLCSRAYNDFILDEWCAVDPGRQLALGILPLWDVAESVREVQRLAAKGIRALAFSENPTVIGLPSIHTDHWDPLWSAIQDADLPVCMHIGSSSKMTSSSDDAPVAVARTLTGCNSMIAMADLLFSGVFERFPGVKVALSEGGAGWVPYILERAMKVWEDRGTRTGANIAPDELFRDHIYVCLVTDFFAIKILEDIGVDNIMWESDFPHDESAWPNDRKILEAAVANVPDDIAVKLAETNARRLFKVP